MNYLLLCAWSTCLLLAFLGYGKLLLGMFQVRDAPWALSAAAGAALTVAAGGILNLLHLVTQPVLVAAVIVGVVLAFLVEWRQLPGVPSTLLGASLAYAPLVLAIAIPVIGNVRADIATFSGTDDLPAYLTLPKATLELKSLPFDPFNERRVTSSLGAPYVLQSLMLVAGDVFSIRAVDISVGFVLYASLLIAIFRLMALPIPLRIGLSFLALLVPVDRLNATMGVLPAALFCALFLIQIHPSLGGLLAWPRSVLLGLTAAALACIKSNYLPAAVLMCAFYYLGWFVYRRHANFLLQGLLCGGVFIGCMLPWMIDMRQKEGTALFPILGRGYDASAYGIVPLPNGSHHGFTAAALGVWLSALPLMTPFLVGLAVMGVAFRKRVESNWIAPLSVMMAACIFAIGAIAFSTGGDSILRYTLPFEVPALIIFVAFLLACHLSLGSWPRWLQASGGIALLALAGLGFLSGVRHGGYRKYLEDARLTSPSREAGIDVNREEQRVRDLQARVPSGERLLARLLLTYPLNFKRNQIFVADYSGMASLPPGMPIEEGPEGMRRYLLSNHIRYLAFDPKRTFLQEGDPESSLHDYLHTNKEHSRHGWIYLQIKVSNTVQRTFGELAALCPHIYDDGEVYLLDLQGTGKKVS